MSPRPAVAHPEAAPSRLELFRRNYLELCGSRVRGPARGELSLSGSRYRAPPRPRGLGSRLISAGEAFSGARSRPGGKRGRWLKRPVT